MKVFRIEIFAYMEVEAESEREAIGKVKDDLDHDPHSIVSRLNFDAEDLTPEVEDEDA